MRKYTSQIVLVPLILLLSVSCVTKKELKYLQFTGNHSGVSNIAGDLHNTVTPATYRIMPYDNLYIRVLTPDPQWSELFNSMPVGVGGALTEESAGLFGYTVDQNGIIEIPFVGQVEVGGKTLSQIKVDLDSIFRGYLTDAAITIRLVNNFISIVGEVNLPGRYPIIKERINIFEALSMAGDMTSFGDRQKIKLIRPSPYGPVIKEFSLSDRSIFSSEFYYVMPNDIIYALPMKGRSFEVNSTIWTLLLSTVTSTLGVIAFFRTL